MKTQASDMQTQPQTRFAFRILAGVMSALILLFSLPYTILEGLEHGGLQIWLMACCCLFGGVGLGVSAWTGHWPFIFSAKKRND
jgi:hypothetical protein